jgi:cellulose synthase/poly-beta-1,6-N-acetylglucosamine synthase-like glycosyltransferase
MSTLVVIALSVVLPFFIIQLLALFALNAEEQQEQQESQVWPSVSILLAARNEEKLILRSLEAMSSFDYPSEQIEILIGDDDSNDNTSSIIREYIKDKPQFKLFPITENLGKGRGKANVLAQLAHKAIGDFYLITDVDVKLPPLWVKEMVTGFDMEIGILSGTTMCDRQPNTFALMQSMDWLHFMGYIKSFANWGIACTSVGNNMAVRKDAYWQTGGFEEIDFSITEDYKLFEAVTGSGWGWKTLLTPNSLGLAHYIPSVSEMLHQRKRWLIGAKDLPLNWKSMILLYGLFLPSMLVLLSQSLQIAMAVWGLKFFLQSIFIYKLCIKVGQKPFSLWDLLKYELYVMTNTLLTLLFYFLPFATKWKGRTYNKAYID